jgi:hypothetical protein
MVVINYGDDNYLIYSVRSQSPSELAMKIFEVITLTDTTTALKLEHNGEEVLAVYPVIEDTPFPKANSEKMGIKGFEHDYYY